MYQLGLGWADVDCGGTSKIEAKTRLVCVHFCYRSSTISDPSAVRGSAIKNALLLLLLPTQDMHA